eukprot:357053-Chlamydomonas_euryale.AAC.2
MDGWMECLAGLLQPHDLPPAGSSSQLHHLPPHCFVTRQPSLFPPPPLLLGDCGVARVQPSRTLPAAVAITAAASRPPRQPSPACPPALTVTVAVIPTACTSASAWAGPTPRLHTAAEAVVAWRRGDAVAAAALRARRRRRRAVAWRAGGRRVGHLGRHAQVALFRLADLAEVGVLERLRVGGVEGCEHALV